MREYELYSPLNNTILIHARMSSINGASLFPPPPYFRQQFRPRQCAGALLLPDRVLQRWLLRAHRLLPRADHAEGVRVQVPLRRGDGRREEGADREGARGKERDQDGGQVLQEVG